MRLLELGVLYGAVGVGCAALRWWAPVRQGRLPEALLLLGLWPLLGPLFLLRQRPMARDERAPPAGSSAGGAVSLAELLRPPAGSPLAALLPEPALVAALDARIAATRARLCELDALLASPRFEAAAARARLGTFEARGHTRAAELARRRLLSIEHLRALRARCARELDEIGELGEQLCAAAELLRLGAGADSAEGLWEELAARVAGVEAVLAEPGLWSEPP